MLITIVYVIDWWTIWLILLGLRSSIIDFLAFLIPVIVVGITQVPCDPTGVDISAPAWILHHLEFFEGAYLCALCFNIIFGLFIRIILSSWSFWDFLVNLISAFSGDHEPLLIKRKRWRSRASVHSFRPLAARSGGENTYTVSRGASVCPCCDWPATHSSRCLEPFHCSSMSGWTMSGWWPIATWANWRHSRMLLHSILV